MRRVQLITGAGIFALELGVFGWKRGRGGAPVRQNLQQQPLECRRPTHSFAALSTTYDHEITVVLCHDGNSRLCA